MRVENTWINWGMSVGVFIQNARAKLNSLTLKSAEEIATLSEELYKAEIAQETDQNAVLMIKHVENGKQIKWIVCKDN